MTWLEMVSEDLKELDICRVDELDGMRWKQFICKDSAAALAVEIKALEDECLVQRYSWQSVIKTLCVCGIIYCKPVAFPIKDN